MAGNAEKKLKALQKSKKKMEPNGDRTGNVHKKADKVADALGSYIRSDNIDTTAAGYDPLFITIEGHDDFRSAVSSIDRAIRNAEEEAAEEKRKKEEEGFKLFGIIPM